MKNYRKKSSYKEIALSYRQGHQAYEAGLSIEGILEALGANKERAMNRLNNGHTLKRVLSGENMFLEMDLFLINVGVETGNLSQVLSSLCLYYDGVYRRNEKVLGGLYYPFLIITFSIVIPFLVSLMINGFQFKYSITSFFIPLLIVSATFFTIRRSLLFPKGTPVSLIETFPSFFKKAQSLIFFYSFSICIKSGISLIDSLKVSKEGIQHLELKKAINRLLLSIERGDGLSEAMINIPFFSEDECFEIERSKYTGTLDCALDNIVQSKELERERRHESLGKLLPRLAGIFIVLLIGYSMVRGAL